MDIILKELDDKTNNDWQRFLVNDQLDMDKTDLGNFYPKDNFLETKENPGNIVIIQNVIC